MMINTIKFAYLAWIWYYWFKKKRGNYLKMKAIVEVQYHGKNVTATDIEKLVKEDVKSQGVKISTVDTLQIYYTPETSSVYYVATTKDGKSVNNEEPLVIE